MAVYTKLSEDQIHQLLQGYDLGSLIKYQGIESGVENTNYLLYLDKGCGSKPHILTLFEYLPEQSLPFFIELTEILNKKGLPTPAPYRDNHQIALQKIAKKPALLQTFLEGKAQPKPQPWHCAAVGKMLAKIHIAGQKTSLFQANQRGPEWLNTQVSRIFVQMPKDKGLILQNQWQSIYRKLASMEPLPKGLIHGDLFDDNVLFKEDKISGVIDFYNACHDWLSYDLAITVNDWCQNKESRTLDFKRLNALLDAYQKERPLIPSEKQAWPLMLKLAAIRFWISRLHTFDYPEPSTLPSNHNALVKRKNPDDFLNLLLYLEKEEQHLSLCC